jgi:predicted PurR-regulated permease PerM
MDVSSGQGHAALDTRGGPVVEARPPGAAPVDTPSPLPWHSWDLTRIILAVVAIGGLIAASFWVLRAFLPAVIWATTIVVATWPALRRVQGWLWGRRSLAVVVMTLLMLATLAVPLTMAVVAIIDHVDDVVTWSRALAAQPLPELPDWVRGVPFVGKRIGAEWQKLASTPDEVAARVTPYLREVARWLIARAGGLGAFLLQFLLTVVVAALLYTQGERAATGVLAFSRRLAGEQGVRVTLLSAGAIRAVALGIVVTALVQAIVGGIGFVLTGVPHAILLACVMLMLGIAQIGPVPVILGAVIWMYAGGHSVGGTVLIVWGLLTASLDNVLRPILIRKCGADLPLVLIIAGVIGGLLAFGLVGLFIGPVVLAVTYTLLVAWVRGGEPAWPGVPGPNVGAVRAHTGGEPAAP